MFGAVDLFIDLQSPLCVCERPVQVPFVLENLADVAGADSHVGMVGSVDLLIDLQSLLCVCERAVQVPFVPRIWPMLFAQRATLGWSGP